MNSLPTSIEKYLIEDAGFSATELLSLRHLLHGDAMTLRELAAKTGKSTGVLDQATKKLIKRKILCKENVNDSLKLTLSSPEAIQAWMRKDIREKQKLLSQKEQNFESFLSSIKLNIARPQIEYFEGEEGIKKAYEKLLDLTDKELFLYMPALCKEEEDPIKEFRMQYLRERKRRKIFLRAISHNTPLGRRFQSRDHFEYRKTSLVSEQGCPIAIEKMIARDTVACFNHKQHRACFIHYPELAEAEREMFEVTLKRSEEQVPVGAQGENTNTIPEETTRLSGVREFFLSKKSLSLFLFFGLFSAIITFGFYSRTVSINTQRIRDRVQAIAATAALDLNGEDLDHIRGWRDAESRVYKDVVHRLQAIKDRNPGVMYAYVMRPTSDEHYYQFVADADSLDLSSWEDFNEDGLINDVVAPGHTWLDEDPQISAISKGLHSPSSDAEPVTDTWGTWISGHAPIYDQFGNSVAIIGIDMSADDVYRLARDSFVPLYWFLGILVLFVILRLIALRIDILALK